jgi:hypothetical protein
MFARTLALLALLTCSAAGAPSSARILIYLKAGLADPASVAYMKQELASSMRVAGYSIAWAEPPAMPDARDSSLSVLELDGPCAPPSAGIAVSANLDVESLASTATSGPAILPFHTLHCDSLNRVIGREMAAASRDHRPWLYGRAMARLAAHELYHYLSGAREHSRDGIAKACFSAQDLLSDSFQFENATLARLRPKDDAEPGALHVTATEPEDNNRRGR